MNGTPSDHIRTPAEVALAMRYTAAQVDTARGIAPSALATLLVTWADILDGAQRDPLPEVVADRLPLAVELDSSADMIAAEAMVNGGCLALGHRETNSFVAWLRECARQAGELQVRAAGFRFDPGRPPPHPDDVVPPTAGLKGEASLRHEVGPRPTDVVPGLETAAGDHVTFALLDRLRARRAAGGRPCDSEDRS